MAKAFIDDENLTDIADAIRAKLGVSTQYLPSEMAGAILSIPKRKVVDFNVSPITLNSAKANSLQYVKAYGKCEQNGTPTPTTPVDILCNNGVLRASINEFDINAITSGYFYNDNLEWVANTSVYTTDYMKTIKGKYTLVLSNVTVVTTNVDIRVNLFNANKEIQSQVVIAIAPDTTEYTYEVEIPNGISYVRISTNPTFVVVSSFSNSQTIYTDGNQETLQLGSDTATCERLLSLNGYTDTQEILSGVVTRKLGVKVLDGTENWKSGGGGIGVWADFQSITGVAFATTDAFCSHSDYGGANVNIVNMNQNEFCLYDNGNISFKNAYTTSTDNWKNWLADQYAAGTPVIVIYPLATATTESVTDQSLQVEAGDNTLEITQSSLPNLEVECGYFLQ